MMLVDMRGLGAQLVLEDAPEPARLWFPSMVKALVAKAQLEANHRIAQALEFRNGDGSPSPSRSGVARSE